MDEFGKIILIGNKVDLFKVISFIHFFFFFYIVIYKSKERQIKFI